MILLGFAVLMLRFSGLPVEPAVARVAEVQARLPWFWSPPLEGFYEIPYLFESLNDYRVSDAHGKDRRPPMTLLLERVPVLGGIYNRCVKQNGASPCSSEMLKVYAQSNEKRAFTSEQSASVREHRRDFWSEFPSAFHFESTPQGRIRFRPIGTYRPRAGSQTELLAAIKGEIEFDPATFEITLLRYEVLKDTAIPGRNFVKGSTYSLTMTKSADGHYLPDKLVFVTPHGKDRIIEQDQYSGYRRFAVDSDIQFGDPPGPSGLPLKPI